MPDWTKSMQQTFEYYIVNPNTWLDDELITNVISCTITRDSSNATLGSASLKVTESLGECYIRVYLITIQNGLREKHCLGTFLVQTPSIAFDGKVRDITADVYTPLLELTEKNPPLGYSILKGTNTLDIAYRLTRENARAPVVESEDSNTLFSDFVSETEDTWLTFISDLLANAKYEFGLDEMGRILFAPQQEIAALQPVWTFNDDDGSILYPDITIERDLYGIPNVVEVVYSDGVSYYTSRVVNDDPNSPISTVSRGREIVYRDVDPGLIGDPTEHQIDQYAEQLLKDLSVLEHTLSYKHGYCPVRLGDCVRLNYTRAGLNNVKAKVISQSISCEPGCPVTEKAVITIKLWE